MGAKGFNLAMGHPGHRYLQTARQYVRNIDSYKLLKKEFEKNGCKEEASRKTEDF